MIEFKQIIGNYLISFILQKTFQTDWDGEPIPEEPPEEKPENGLN